MAGPLSTVRRGQAGERDHADQWAQGNSPPHGAGCRSRHRRHQRLAGLHRAGSRRRRHAARRHRRLQRHQHARPGQELPHTGILCNLGSLQRFVEIQSEDGGGAGPRGVLRGQGQHHHRLQAAQGREIPRRQRDDRRRREVHHRAAAGREIRLAEQEQGVGGAGGQDRRPLYRRDRHQAGLRAAAGLPDQRAHRHPDRSPQGSPSHGGRRFRPGAGRHRRL